MTVLDKSTFMHGVIILSPESVLGRALGPFIIGFAILDLHVEEGAHDEGLLALASVDLHLVLVVTRPCLKVSAAVVAEFA